MALSNLVALAIDRMNGSWFPCAKAVRHEARSATLIGVVYLFSLSYLFSLVEAVAQQPSAATGDASHQIPVPIPRPNFASPAPNHFSDHLTVAPPLSPAQSIPLAGEDDAANHCLADLKMLGADFMITASDRLDGRCPLVTPIDITSLNTPTGPVTFPGKPTFRCAFALQFVTWLSNVAAPLVRVFSGSGLATVETGPGYVCRTRNGDASASAKMSEHAAGNAVDITALGLADKRQIGIAAVANESNRDYRLLMALRRTACGYFTTVLGPGANAAHATHYHLDLGIHGNSGNYRICE